jgi:adenylate cyclase
MAGHVLREPFRLGDHWVTPGANEINDQRIEPKAMDVLVLLADAAPDVVSTTSLLERAWPEVVVGDNVVHQAIARLRKTLGDDARSPRYIEHVPRRGYRLLVTPQGTEDGEGANGRVAAAPHANVFRRSLHYVSLVTAIAAMFVVGWLSYEYRQDSQWRFSSQREDALSTSNARPYNSLAVLSFVDLSPDQNHQYFADGVAEEILTALAASRQLTVIARSSSFAFREQNLDIETIAEKLNVRHVLEGSVRLAGGHVRIDVRLVDAATSAQRWSQVYDGQLADLFALQTDIPRNVAERLEATVLLTGTPTEGVDPDAYVPYLQARHLLYESDLGKLPEVKALLDQALMRDPSFAPAWLQLAELRHVEMETGRRPWDEAWRLAREAVERAYALEPDSNVVHAWLVWIAMFLDNDLVRAAEHLERSLVGDPTDTRILLAASQALHTLGRAREAIEFGEYVVGRDPLCGVCYSSLGKAYMYAGQLDEAERSARKAVPLWADPRRLWQLGHILMLKDNPADALAVYDEMPVTVPERFNGIAIASYALDRPREFEAAFGELRTRCTDTCPELIAHVYAWIGEPDLAFDWLRKRAGDRTFFTWTHWAMPLRPLHDDPRWPAFLESQGQSPAQLAAVPLRVNVPNAPSRPLAVQLQ